MSRIEQALEKALQARQGQTREVGEPLVRRQAKAGGYVLPDERLPVEDRLVVTEVAPRSPAAEEFRKLKSRVMRECTAGSCFNSLMVASSVMGEGKSMVAVNLAITLSHEYDHTVLLVDADLRRPTIHRYFGLDAGPGLGEALLEGGDFPVVRTGIGRLSVLRAGTVAKNPVEIFSSQRAKDFFAEMKARYPDRLLIVDTPPVLPFADARVLSSMVDGVVFVAREGVTSVPALQEAVAAVGESAVLGVVYNCCQGEPETTRYHAHYYQEAAAAPCAALPAGAAAAGGIFSRFTRRKSLRGAE